jgi:hypothetical protein
MERRVHKVLEPLAWCAAFEIFAKIAAKGSSTGSISLYNSLYLAAPIVKGILANLWRIWYTQVINLSVLVPCTKLLPP